MGSHSHSLHSVGDWAEVSKLCVLELLLLPALLCGRLVVVTSALCSSLMTLFCSLFPGPLRHIPPHLSLHLFSSLPVGWASSSLQWEAGQPNSRHTRLGDSRRKSWLRLLCQSDTLTLTQDPWSFFSLGLTSCFSPTSSYLGYQAAKQTSIF